MTGLWVALGTLAVAAVLGLLWQRRQGRVSASAGSVGSVGSVGSALPDEVRSVATPDAVTLLMLSAPVCARCPQARTLLDEVARTTPGLRRAELDLGAHPDVATALEVRSTPTTLALSGGGDELFRVVGVPRRAELLDALAPHL